MANVVSVWSSLFWRYLPVLVTFTVWGIEKYVVRKKKVGSVGEEKKRSHHAAAERKGASYPAQRTISTQVN